MAITLDCRLQTADALAQYGQLVIDLMSERRVSTAELSRSVGVDRSYLCKVRRGERPMTARLLDDLIAALDLDRQRMALAVGVLGRQELYKDPVFANVSAFADAMLSSLLDLLQRPGRLDRASIFAAMSSDSCGVLATQSIKHVQARFAKLELLLDAKEDVPSAEA